MDSSGDTTFFEEGERLLKLEGDEDDGDTTFFEEEERRLKLLQVKEDGDGAKEAAKEHSAENK